MVLSLPDLRVYRCDFGHEWTVRVQHDTPEVPSECVCAEGHEAVTRIDMSPCDRVQIVFRPAAVSTGRAGKSARLEGQFYVALLDPRGGAKLETSRTYSWDGALRVASYFPGKTLEEAQSLWLRHKL